MQTSHWADVEHLYEKTTELVRTYRIILIHPCYDEPINDQQNQYVTGYVIIAERLENEQP